MAGTSVVLVAIPWTISALAAIFCCSNTLKCQTKCQRWVNVRFLSETRAGINWQILEYAIDNHQKTTILIIRSLSFLTSLFVLFLKLSWDKYHVNFVSANLQALQTNVIEWSRLLEFQMFFNVVWTFHCYVYFSANSQQCTTISISRRINDILDG